MSVLLPVNVVRARIAMVRAALGELDYGRLSAICDLLDDNSRVSLADVHKALGVTASENAKSQAVRTLRVRLDDSAAAAGVDLTFLTKGSRKLGAEARYLEFRAASAPSPQSPTADVDRLNDSLVTEQRATSRTVTLEYDADDVSSLSLAVEISARARATNLMIDDPHAPLPGERRDRPASPAAAARVLILSAKYLAAHPDAGEAADPVPTIVVRAEPLPASLDLTWTCSGGRIPNPGVFSDTPRSGQARFVNDVLDLASSCLNRDASHGEPPLPPALPPRTPGGSKLDIDDLGPIINDAHAAPSWSREYEVRKGVGRGRPLQASLVEWLNDRDGKKLCAVLGESGVGKTINAQLFYNSIRDDPAHGLVFYFDLRITAGFPFAEFRALQAQTPRLRLADALLEHCMRSWRDNPYADLPSLVAAASPNKSVWIVDGLDEALVHLSAAEGRSLGRDLLELARSFSEAKLLLTCRDHFFESISTERAYFSEQHSGRTEASDYLAFKLLPFDNEQIERYVRGALGDGGARQAIETIRSIHDLQGLAARPFNLKLVLDHLPLIADRAKSGERVSISWLYQLITEDWLARDAGKHQFQGQDKLRLMGHLAWWTWSRGTRSISATHLNDWLSQAISGEPLLALRYAQSTVSNQGEQLLQEDLRTATFLVRADLAGGASEFRFAHSSLHEFFLASHLFRSLGADEPGPWRIPTPSRETLDFIISLIDDAADSAELRKQLAVWAESFDESRSRVILGLAARSLETGASDIELPRFDFGGANWRGLSIGSANSRSLKLRVANARNTDLRGSTLYGVDLSHADLSHAELNWSRFHAVLFDGATLDGTIAPGAFFRKCKWGTTTFDSDLFREAHVIEARGDHAPRQIHGAQRRIEANLGSKGATMLAFSPDGTRFVTASGEGATVWDTTTWEVLHTFASRTNNFRALAFSPDGTKLVIGGEGTTAWDTTTWEASHKLSVGRPRVLALAFSPDGTKLVTGDFDGATVWDTSTWEAGDTLRGGRERIWSIAFSPDGTKLLIGGTRKRGRVEFARVLDTATFEVCHEFPSNESRSAAFAFSPDGTRLVIGGAREGTSIWDTGNWQIVATIGDVNGHAQALAFSPDGAELLVGGMRGTTVWDTTTWEKLRVLPNQEGWVENLAFCPDGSKLAMNDMRGNVVVWDAATWEVLHNLHRASHWARALAFSPDGTRLAISGAEGTTVWNTTSWGVLHTLRRGSDRLHALAFSPDGTRLAIGGGEGTIVLDTSTWEASHASNSDDPWVEALAFSPDGTRLVVASGAGATVWDTGTWQQLHAFADEKHQVGAVAFSPDGTKLATGGLGGLKVWDAHGWQPICALDSSDRHIRAMSFSPDGTRLVTSGFQSGVLAWNTTSWEDPETVLKKDHWVPGLTFTPDGAWLATCGLEGVTMWDTTNWNTSHTVARGFGWVQALALSPDGKTLVTGSSVVRVFNLEDTDGPPLSLFASRGGAASWIDGSGDFSWRMGDTSEHVWMRVFDPQTDTTVAWGPAEEFLGAPPG